MLHIFKGAPVNETTVYTPRPIILLSQLMITKAMANNS